ncbi:MAG: hypothetical protein COA58_03525 [Bacteroidetes bacterium]|nr:MAG: hypothetical protein COA58_03525 [Bacteroidota bacterium]
MRYIIAFLIFCFALGLSAQEEYDNEDDDTEISDYSPSSDFFDWKSRLYLGFSNSFYVDFITSPLSTYKVEYAEPGGGVRYDDAAAQTGYSSFFTIGIEPRYNLFDLSENFAVAASSGVYLGFGQTYAANSKAASANGFGNVQIPLFLRLYYGAGSTFAATDDFGINVGAGYELNKIGIFNFSTSESDGDLNPAWIMPSITGGVIFYRGSTPVEVNLKYGFGPIQDQIVDQFGNRLSEGKISTHARSIKLSIVYALR